MKFSKKHVALGLILLSVLILFTFLPSKHKEVEDPSRKEAYIQEQLTLANKLLKQNEVRSAISKLEALHEAYPKSIEVLENLAFAYSDYEDHGLAAMYYEQILNVDPSLNEYRLFAAQSYVTNKNYDDAIRCYRTYLEKNPYDLSTWKFLGQCFEKNKDTKKAIAAYEQAFPIGSEFVTENSCLKIAALYEKIDLKNKATDWLEEATRVNPKKLSTRIKLMAREMKNHQWDRAKKHLVYLEKHYDAKDPRILEARRRYDHHRKSLSKNKQPKPTINKPASVAEKATQHSLAKATPASPKVNHSLKKEKATTPSDAELFKEENNKTSQAIYISTPKAPKNCEKAQKATEAHPENQISSLDHLRSAIDCQNCNNYKGAIDECWKALTLNPNPALYWLQLAQAYHGNEDYANAEMAILEARRRKPKDLAYKLVHLKIIKASKSTEVIMDELRKAKQEYPNSSEITLELAKGYHKLEGDFRNAKYLYKLFLDQAPEHPENENVREFLNTML